MPSTRRSLLWTTPPVLAVLAGCPGLGGEPPDFDPNPTPSSTATPVAVGTEQRAGEAHVMVTRVVAQSSVVHLTSPDSMGVATTDGWFVLVQVRASDHAPARDEFVLVVGGAEHEPTGIGFGRGFVVERGLKTGYDAQTAEGWLAFAVSRRQSEPETRIEFRDAAWRLPGGINGTLARPPPLLVVTVVRGSRRTPSR